MGLGTAIRKLVGVANSLTSDMQPTVIHESYTGETGSGDHTFAAPVHRPAIVNWERRQVRTAEGELTVSRASVTFLDPTVIVNDQDRITLPDGTTGPILDMSGPYVESSATLPVLTQVFLG